MSIKFLSAILGPENGCTNFYGAPRKKCVSFCRKAHVHKIPPFKGGVIWVFFFWGGGECRFYLYGREDFSEKKFNAKCFVQSFFRQPFGSWTSAPKIVDVRTKRCVFAAAPVVGRNVLTPGHPGVRVRNVRGKIPNPDQEVYVLCCFFLP